MLSFLPPPLVGVIVSTLFVLNLVIWAVPVYTAILFKLIIPLRGWRRAWTRIMDRLCGWWAACNSLLAETCHRRTWEIRGVEHLRRNAQYLVISNHQTWNDIYVVMHALGGRVAFFRFFIKQELIWVPILGLVWWALDFPFMKRYSREQLRRNPELAGKDLETAHKSCEKYHGMPVTVLNYLEGTRFTEEKRARQNSPYRHLLRPKTGGLAFAAAALGEDVNTLLDVTIVYREGALSFWDFMCGKNHHVVVDVKTRQIPHHWYGANYQQDPDFRRLAQAWVAELWQEKDELIEREKAGFGD